MRIFALFTLLLAAGGTFAQGGIKDPSQKEPCYKKAEKRSKQRFAEWECGKIAGVVDCNEKLELDQASNTVITSTGKSPFSGTCETCHSNGILERRVTFVNGKQNGTDTTYYASGCLMVVRTHVMGAENGRSTYYYDSLGTIAWEMNHSVGQQHGQQVYYSKKKDASGNGLQGDTTKYEYYNNGILNGQKVTYYKGKRTRMVTYTNGVFNGPFILYNDEGKIIEELTYKNGKKEGIFKYYYDDGTLLRTESWSGDQKNGEFKTFYYEQNLQKTENYRKGVKEGWFEEYFPNQKLKRRALYKKDVLIEEHVFNEQGTEVRTFGAPAIGDKEDDDAPGAKKGEKKKKSKKEDKPTTPAP